MRIGMVLDERFPPDPRVANEARSLIAAGHEVALFCLKLGEEPEREKREGIEIVRQRIARAFWKKARALILSVPAYRLWMRPRLARFVAGERIQALHIHDLPLVGEGLRAAHRAGIPLVADLHENYPAAVRVYEWSRRWPARWLVRPAMWEAYERRVIPMADRVIVVVDEARDRLVANGIAHERITVVENTVNVDEFMGFPRDRELIDRLAAHFTVSYTGVFDHHRGLDTALEALALLRDEMPEARLALVGRGRIEAALAERARELGIADRVLFEGWQPFSRFPSYMEGSAVCLIPHRKNAHTDATIPHKLFHAMLLERPVVVSDCAPLERIVRETGAGVVFPSGDAGALAERLLALRDRETRERYAAAGQRAVLERYRWDFTAKGLLALYAALSGEGPRRPRS
ncbi:MAG: glycosyltransferase family 4 protein [Candidatus Eisenbacteria bacterium]|nr:glycosyltransferase family 4 protein [Candidatus Eisenbacteria bacterium]